MRKALLIACSAGCFGLGLALGLAAKDARLPGINAVQGKPPKEAAQSALGVATTLAKQGTWERLAIARVYYLALDKPRGQQLIDEVLAGKKLKGTDFQRAGQIYDEAGEHDRAEQMFTRALAMDSGDDTGQAEIGAWYIRRGEREKGEALLTQAFAKNPDELWHYVRAAEAYLNLAPR
jgi:tetratricopeptide (TPR) repeat protein